jgi:carboxyl-terminal processing protease
MWTLRAHLAIVVAALAGMAADRTAAQVPDLVPPVSAPSDPRPIVSAPAPAPQDADQLYRRALELERQHDWPSAIEVYHDALERWPGRVEFRHRLLLCETHYKLGRRYQDRSFRQLLVTLDREQALALYDEVVQRIEQHYVEPVALEALLRRGFDNLEVALRDPVFLQTHASRASAESVKATRETLLASRRSCAARDRSEARSLVLGACDRVHGALGVPPQAVVLEFVYGACDPLDEYSSYLSPDRLGDLYAMIDGNFVGLGVELKLDEPAGGLLLVNVLRGGPASEAGIQPGDRIIEVDGVSLAGLDLDAAANKLQGVEGSEVRVKIVAARDGGQRSYRLIRRPVEVQSVSAVEMVDTASGIGYIQLSGFQKTSTVELQAAIADLQQRGMRYLVLDLRGNPGGLLNIAVEIADRFLPGGLIVSTRGRAAGQSQVYRASGRPLWHMPMAVLVDHDSASASEILAGALQDNHRAVVIGERSYGKGSVQSIFPLRSASAGLKLTTAKFYSPTDRAYSEQGVMPDTVVRTAARPKTETDTASLPALTFGKPDRDPVLRAALDLARRGLTRRAG